MADNFNLRSFLSENKLTKNAQLLNEGTYLVTVNIPSRKMDIGSKQEASSEEEAIQKAIQYIEQEYPGVEYQVKGARLRQEAQPSTMDLSKVDTNSIEIDGVDPSDRPDFVDAYISYAEYEDGTPLTDGELEELTSEMPDLVNQLANDSLYEKAQNNKPTMKETKLTAKERRLVEMVNNAMGMEEEVDEMYGGHDDQYPLASYTSGGSNRKEEPKTPQEPEKKSFLQKTKERLGFNESEGEENVDYTMGHQDDQNQLPNPAPELNIPEGDEMGDETVIPEYNTIDELMNSIDHGTNKVAEEHKMQEMKKIAQMLREKAKKMEESEHAAHISPKDLKQLATDAAKLEKAAEKLKSAFDKKFNKKEKVAAAPKAEKVEALQENKNTMENFDLKKFLTENKLTTNSRMLNEALAKTYKVVKTAQEGNSHIMDKRWQVGDMLALEPNAEGTQYKLSTKDDVEQTYDGQSLESLIRDKFIVPVS